MNMLVQKGFFVFRAKFIHIPAGVFRKFWYRLLGMRIGRNTYLPKIITTFPNQVSLGNNCVLEKNIYFKYDGIWQEGTSINIGNNVFIGHGCEFNINYGLFIGKYSNIASGCKFIDHDHGIKAGKLIGPQSTVKKIIVLEEDVWLGCNVVVLKGVRIGTGAVVGAGAVVTKSIPAYEIWGGVPAKKINVRR